MNHLNRAILQIGRLNYYFYGVCMAERYIKSQYIKIVK